MTVLPSVPSRTDGSLNIEIFKNYLQHQCWEHTGVTIRHIDTDKRRNGSSRVAAHTGTVGPSDPQQRARQVKCVAQGHNNRDGQS